MKNGQFIAGVFVGFVLALGVILVVNSQTADVIASESPAELAALERRLEILEAESNESPAEPGYDEAEILNKIYSHLTDTGYYSVSSVLSRTMDSVTGSLNNISSKLGDINGTLEDIEYILKYD